MHAANRRLKLEQSVEDLCFVEKSQPALVVYRPCGTQMLSEVTFRDERGKHSLRQQSSVAVCGMLRVDKGSDEDFRHDCVGDPQGGEQNLVEAAHIDHTVAVHVLQGGDRPARI